MFHITPEQDDKNAWLIKTMRGLESSEVGRLLDHGTPEQRAEIVKRYNRIHIAICVAIVAFLACILGMQFLWHLDTWQVLIVSAVLIAIAFFLKTAQLRKNREVTKSILASISEKSKSSKRR